MTTPIQPCRPISILAPMNPCQPQAASRPATHSPNTYSSCEGRTVPTETAQNALFRTHVSHFSRLLEAGEDASADAFSDHFDTLMDHIQDHPEVGHEVARDPSLANRLLGYLDRGVSEGLSVCAAIGLEGLLKTSSFRDPAYREVRSRFFDVVSRIFQNDLGSLDTESITSILAGATEVEWAVLTPSISNLIIDEPDSLEFIFPENASPTALARFEATIVKVLDEAEEKGLATWAHRSKDAVTLLLARPFPNNHALLDQIYAKAWNALGHAGDYEDSSADGEIDDTGANRGLADLFLIENTGASVAHGFSAYRAQVIKDEETMSSDAMHDDEPDLYSAAVDDQVVTDAGQTKRLQIALTDMEKYTDFRVEVRIMEVLIYVVDRASKQNQASIQAFASILMDILSTQSLEKSSRDFLFNRVCNALPESIRGFFQESFPGYLRSLASTDPEDFAS